MNNLNEDDADTSSRVHTFVRSVVAYGAKNKFLAGPYHYSIDDEETVTLYVFLGTDIIRSHI